MIYDLIRKAEDEKNINMYMNLLHEEYSCTMHSSGKKFNKQEIKPFIEKIFNQNNLNYINPRCIYENDEVLIRHQIMAFENGTKEAVLVVEIKKDGKIIKMETGATPL